MKYLIGNFKMQLNARESVDLIQTLEKRLVAERVDLKSMEVVVCPPYTALSALSPLKTIRLGAQDAFWEDRGSCTGEISPADLYELGCRYVILGHSSRRMSLSETDEMIRKKVEAVLSDGLAPIICVGETLDERMDGKKDLKVIEQVLSALRGIEIGTSSQKIIIAYEPVWAIGTGKPVEPEEAEYMHQLIYQALSDLFPPQAIERSFAVVYGGSVDSENVSWFLEKEAISGALIGGASVRLEEFLSIIRICNKQNTEKISNF